MGICFSNNFRKINDFTVLPSNNFHDIQKILINFIHSFHSIKRSCVIGYNVSIQKNFRQPAEILLKKRRYIKSCLKALRDYIKKLDYAIEFHISGNEKANIIHEIQIMITNFDFGIVVNDVRDIINPNTDPLYLKKVDEIIEKKDTSINMEEIHHEINVRILQTKDQLDERLCFRRKYNRSCNDFYSKAL
ncbi:hypothetical protein SteCoe_12212 [Stentor coeruleus]|uniref:Uncharacterized protein n=1 Tax=Stentor coeruleus TaxID=5963 RepID=A0A1R2CBG2_9CILI|nr:hypothetical protein SteCoe_12212 [Stentor coeruleus]